MSAKANPTVIGAFTLTAVALLLAGVSYFGGGKFLTKTTVYVADFESSLSGLSVGAPVLFRGVRVGSVKDIIVQYEAARDRPQIPVYLEIEVARFKQIGNTGQFRQTHDYINMLIKDHGLRAQLGFQSFLTGLKVIELDFHDNAELRLVGTDPGVREMPTIQSQVDAIAKKLENLTLEELVFDLRNVLQGINHLVRSDDLGHAVGALDEALTHIAALAERLSNQVEPVAQELMVTSEEVRTALRAGRERLASIETALVSTLRSYEQLAEPLSADLHEATAAVVSTMAQARASLAAIEAGVGPESTVHHRVTRALTDLSSALKAVRGLAEYLERHPEAMLRGKNTNGE
jgi:paraquat-inducible protein B